MFFPKNATKFLKVTLSPQIGLFACSSSRSITISSRYISHLKIEGLMKANVCSLSAVRHFNIGKCYFKPDVSSPSSTMCSTSGSDPKLVTNEEWAAKLTPEQYFCAREGGTEPPFSGQYYNAKGEGLYNCVCCGTELFSSKTKYDSGSGWPSFNSPIRTDGGETTNEDSSEVNSNVLKRKDVSHGMVRLEVICKNCNAHLGHVFEDGPEPTGERYCINSNCLKFQPKKLWS